jgi:uncharacterized protein YndB with AHSA1/START domain
MPTTIIRRGLQLAALSFAIGWVLDRVLRRGDPDAPPPAVRSLIVIDAPIERVWTELADIEGQPRWMHEMKSVRLLTPPPVGVGTRGEATVRIFGVGVTDPVEVTEFTPPHRFAIRHEGTFTGSGLITLEPGADGSTTILRWDETLIAPVLPYLAARLQAPVFGAIFQGDLERFRAICEA